jgi:hypothetical protein
MSQETAATSQPETAGGWKTLGYVNVSAGGHLLLVDSVHVEEHDLHFAVGVHHDDGQITIEPDGDLGVLVPIGLGDGHYRVEGRYELNELREIRVRFRD